MRIRIRPSPMLAFLALVASTTGAPSRAVAADFEIAPREYVAELEKRMLKVEQFKALRQWGIANGVRVWTAGGTATGLGVYIRQDLEREWRKKNGLPSVYYDSKFTYNYFDVFRSTQDADIIIDGDEKAAQKLEEYLHTEFDFLQGSKSVWEVRLLDKPRGEGVGKKESLINNPDFLGQNSDSFSTGMVELTPPAKGESIVRDLFAWKSPGASPFLRDLLRSGITYYRNPLHRTTSRYLAGWNPELISAVRCIGKSAQYGGNMDAKTEATVLAVIAEFDPTSKEWAQEPARRYLRSNVLKSLWHSQDLEAVSAFIDRSGLRAKLAAFANTYSDKELKKWIARIPLPSFPVGRGAPAPWPGKHGGAIGTGRTAEFLGITEVAHETGDFLAFESITNSRRGKPNFFQSIEGNADEVAAYGDGVYTKRGKYGARNTGLTIRMRVKPNAIDGVDFLHLPKEDYVIFRNAGALEVIDESLNLGFMDFLKILDAQTLGSADRGLIQKIRLKLKTSPGKIDVPVVRKMLEEERLRLVHGTKPNLPIWQRTGEWPKVIETLQTPVLESLIDIGDPVAGEVLADRIALAKGHFASEDSKVAALFAKVKFTNAQREACFEPLLKMKAWEPLGVLLVQHWTAGNPIDVAMLDKLSEFPPPGMSNTGRALFRSPDLLFHPRFLELPRWKKYALVPLDFASDGAWLRNSPYLQKILLDPRMPKTYRHELRTVVAEIVNRRFTNIMARMLTPGSYIGGDDYKNYIAEVAHPLSRQVPGWESQIGELMKRFTERHNLGELLQTLAIVAAAPAQEFSSARVDHVLDVWVKDAGFSVFDRYFQKAPRFGRQELDVPWAVFIAAMKERGYVGEVSPQAIFGRQHRLATTAECTRWLSTVKPN